MDKNNYSEVSKNLENAMLKFSKEISEFIKNVNIDISLDTFQSLFEFVQGIPDDVKDTKFFHAVQHLEKPNLQYEDIQWLIKDFGIENFDDALSEFLESIDKNIELHCYLRSIVLNDNIRKREKVIILLAHMEPLIYDTLNYSKKPKHKLKTIVRQLSIDKNNGMSSESIGKLFVLGVMYVVFANTDSYTEDIDKRLPFRNNILHNGIVLYTDKDIDMVYSILIDFLSMLVQVKPKL
jgi:hypothetical protein